MGLCGVQAWHSRSSPVSSRGRGPAPALCPPSPRLSVSELMQELLLRMGMTHLHPNAAPVSPSSPVSGLRASPGRAGGGDAGPTPAGGYRQPRHQGTCGAFHQNRDNVGHHGGAGSARPVGAARPRDMGLPERPSATPSLTVRTLRVWWPPGQVGPGPWFPLCHLDVLDAPALPVLKRCHPLLTWATRQDGSPEGTRGGRAGPGPHVAVPHPGGRGAGQARGPASWARVGAPTRQPPCAKRPHGLSRRRAGAQAAPVPPETRSTLGRRSPTPSTWTSSTWPTSGAATASPGCEARRQGGVPLPAPARRHGVLSAPTGPPPGLPVPPWPGGSGPAAWPPVCSHGPVLPEAPGCVDRHFLLKEGDEPWALRAVAMAFTQGPSCHTWGQGRRAWCPPPRAQWVPCRLLGAPGEQGASMSAPL